MSNKYKAVCTYWFLAALALLLLNDFLLKDIYGNWATGKASDFTGLFIFPLFWAALFPAHKTKIFWLSGLCFIFWKSAYSQPLLTLWNSTGLFPINRVIDYTDLLALSVLPLAYLLQTQKHKAGSVHISPAPVLLVAAFSFMATSYNQEVNINKSYQLNYPKDTLISRLAQIDSLNYGTSITFSPNNPDTLYFAIPAPLCYNNFRVRIIVTEANGGTNLTLLTAEHACSKKKETDQKDLLKIFEEVVIANISRPPN